MTDPTTPEKAIRALVALNATITNLRLYPPTSATIGNSCDKAFELLHILFENEDSVVFAESEKILVVSGQALDEKEQKKDHVTTFIQLMANLGIKSIALEKGLDRDELLTFLKIASRKPDDLAKSGGLQKAAVGANLQHVFIDQKVYVAMDKDHRIVSSDETVDGDGDENVVKLIMGDSDSGVDMASFRDAAKDPKWVAKIFRSGIAQITQQAGATPSEERSKSVIHMIDTLGKVVDSDSKEEILMQIVDSLADMDIEILSVILAQSPQSVLGEDVFDNVLDRLDGKKSASLASRIKQLEASGTGRRTGGDRRRTHSLEHLLAGGVDRRQKRDQRKSRLMHVKAGLNSIVKGETEAFQDSQVMLSVPNAVDQLFSEGKTKIAEGIINRLCEGLLSQEADVRADVAAAVAHINLNFATKKRTGEMLRLSHELLEWIRFETAISPGYKHICNQLRVVAQALIRSRQFNECNQVLEPFYLIHSGKMEKNENIQAISGDVLKSTGTDDILDLLLQGLKTGKPHLREQAANALTMIGSYSVGHLLDILRDGQDASEADRILQIIAEIGTVASPFLVQQIEQGGPTHYIRDLLLLLGKVGTWRDRPILRGLLRHEDAVIRGAADKSLAMVIGRGDKQAESEHSTGEEIAPSTDEGTAELGETEQVEDDLAQEMGLVDRHVQQNDTESAVKVLFDLTVKYAREKDFPKADFLSEKLLEVDPMALTEIVKVGEIVEEEKRKSIDQDHLGRWKEIYDTLSDEETNALYYAMKSDACDEGQPIISEGEVNSRLYFVDEGQLKITYHKDGEEFLIKKITPGDIAGDDSFLHMSVGTTTVSALSPVKYRFLEKTNLEIWEEELPALVSKLTSYCGGLVKTLDLLKKKDLDRRTHTRVAVEGRIVVNAVDDSGMPTAKIATGTLSDISQGGLCFDAKISKEGAVAMFTARRINMQFVLPTGDSPNEMNRNGVVVGVHYQMYDNSVNVKFDAPLDESVIKAIEVPKHTDEDILGIEQSE